MSVKIEYEDIRKAGEALLNKVNRWMNGVRMRLMADKIFKRGQITSQAINWASIPISKPR